jgi:zinc protease
MQRLREARGLNYGDYAYIEHFQQEGGDQATAQTGRARQQQEFTIWLRPVRNENRLFAVRAALYELARSLGDEPFSAEEVEQTKGFLDGYILLFDQTDARKLGYALDDQFYGMSAFLASWRSALRGVSADQVNAAWRKWIDPAKLEIVLAGSDMASVKKIVLSDDPTPIHYQQDASGKTPEKPATQLATDREIEKFPFGAKGDADVQVVSVDRMFE